MHNVTFNRDVIDWAQRSKTPLVVAFLDFEKAFDRIRLNYLWKVLDQFGFPMELGTDIRALYTRFSSTLLRLVPGATQVVLRSSRGVRQGCTLSPALFALFAEPLGALIDALGAGGPSSPPLGVLLPAVAHRSPLRIADSQYADDVVVYAHSVANCSSIIAAVETEFCLAAGARLNCSSIIAAVETEFCLAAGARSNCKR
jgi:hypothetical protein